MANVGDIRSIVHDIADHIPATLLFRIADRLENVQCRLAAALTGSLRDDATGTITQAGTATIGADTAAQALTTATQECRAYADRL